MDHHRHLLHPHKPFPHFKNRTLQPRIQSALPSVTKSLSNIDDKKTLRPTQFSPCKKSSLSCPQSEKAEAFRKLLQFTSVSSIPLIDRLKEPEYEVMGSNISLRDKKQKEGSHLPGSISKKSRKDPGDNGTVLSLLMMMSQSSSKLEVNSIPLNFPGMKNESMPLPLWHRISSKPLSNSSNSQLTQRGSSRTFCPSPAVHHFPQSNGLISSSGKLLTWERFSKPLIPLTLNPSKLTSLTTKSSSLSGPKSHPPASFRHQTITSPSLSISMPLRSSSLSSGRNTPAGMLTCRDSFTPLKQLGTIGSLSTIKRSAPWSHSSNTFTSLIIPHLENSNTPSCPPLVWVPIPPNLALEEEGNQIGL
jgi:hypothetical protein